MCSRIQNMCLYKIRAAETAAYECGLVDVYPVLSSAAESEKSQSCSWIREKPIGFHP